MCKYRITASRPTYYFVDDLTIAHSRYRNLTWRKTDMNFEEKKTTSKEVTENSDALSKNLKSESEKNQLTRRGNVLEKSQSESKKFDAIHVKLYTTRHRGSTGPAKYFLR